MVARVCIVDVETSGTDPERHDAWDIAVIVREQGLSDAEHQWFIPPAMATADPMALVIGGYYDRTADLKPAGTRDKNIAKWADPVKVARELALLLDRAVLVGQNPWFDAAFVSKLLRKHGHVLTADYHYQSVGTMLLCWLRAQGFSASLRLDDLARAAGMDLDRYDRHSALGDARLARDALDVVMGKGWLP